MLDFLVKFLNNNATQDFGLDIRANRSTCQCLDPFDYTNGGTVTFEITPKKKSLDKSKKFI